MTGLYSPVIFLYIYTRMKECKKCNIKKSLDEYFNKKMKKMVNIAIVKNVKK